MKYTVLTGKVNEDPEAFLKNVNDALAKGWKPLGGVSLSKDLDVILAAQALVKHEHNLTQGLVPLTDTEYKIREQISIRLRALADMVAEGADSAAGFRAKWTHEIADNIERGTM